MEGSSAGMGHNMPSLTDRLAIEFEDLLNEVQRLADKANQVKAVVDEKGVKSDDDLIPMVEIGREATKLSTLIPKKRLARTEELRNDVETINGFFKTVENRITRIKNAFAEKVGEYEREKRAREAREAAERARRAEEEAAAKLKEAEEAQNSVLSDVLLDEAAKAEQERQMMAKAAVSAGTGPTRTDAGTVSMAKKWTFSIDDMSKIPLEELRPYLTVADIEKAVRGYVRANRDTRPLAGVRIYEDVKTSFR